MFQERPTGPQDRRDRPYKEGSDAVHDGEVETTLKKNVVRLPNTAVKGVISDYLAHPKKIKGKFF